MTGLYDPMERKSLLFHVKASFDAPVRFSWRGGV